MSSMWALGFGTEGEQTAPNAEADSLAYGLGWPRTCSMLSQSMYGQTLLLRPSSESWHVHHVASVP